MDKKAILRESITRLIQLGISDKEIIDNLRGVGIDGDSAKVLLSETRKELSSGAAKPQMERPGQKAKSLFVERPPEPKPAPEPEEDVQIPDDEDIYAKVEEEETPPKKIDVESAASYRAKSNSMAGQSYAASHVPPRLPDEDVSELWEKGILATVDAKLNEMKRIRADLDSVIGARVQEKIQLESRKIETVLESQRSLFYGKIDAHLDARAEELGQVLGARAKSLEDLNAKVQDSLRKMQGENKFKAELLNTLNDKLTGLDTVKSQMISETNTSLIGMESKFAEFMGESEGKRGEYEARLNSALELQSKITEGLTEDLRQKIDSLKFEKEEQLTQRLQAKMGELDRLISQVDSKGVSEKLAKMKEQEQQLNAKQKELDQQFAKSQDSQKKYIDSVFADLKKELASYRKEVSKVQAEGLDELRKEYAANVDQLFAENLVEWDRKLKEKKKEIDSIKETVDVEKFEASMESLDLFKQQFLNTVKRSIEDYNKSKKELAEGMIARDKAITEHLKSIDEKMEELSAFEKRFSREVGGLLGELQDAKGRREDKPDKAYRKARPED